MSDVLQFATLLNVTKIRYIRRVFKPHYANKQYMYARAFFFVQGDLLCD